LKKQKGQSLWEIIIALAIASLVAVGLIRSSSTAIRTTRFSGDQTEATALAQKKISTIIDAKNTNPSGFWNIVASPGDNRPYETDDISNPGYCLKSSLFNDYDSLSSSIPNYDEAKFVKISVDIYWEETGSGTQCGAKDYNHVLNFVTHVSN
jgi:type II secretory pathway pseudopilin PulG